MMKLYNEEYKKTFLENTYFVNTARTNAYVLAKAYGMEDQLGKDLYEFTFDELDSLYYALKAKTEQSMYSWHSVMRTYIQYAIDNGYISGINYADGITDLKKYVSKLATEMRYLSEEDVYDIAFSCDNAQDGVILPLLFEGLSIQNNLEELTNLQEKDLFGNSLFLKNRGEYIQITDKLVELINEALHQTMYLKNIIDPRAKAKALPLAETQYLLKPAARKDNKYKPDAQIIRQRLSRLKNEMNNPFITPTTIWISGQISYAKKLKAHLGIDKLNNDHYRLINKRFGYSEIYITRTRERIEKFI